MKLVLLTFLGACAVWATTNNLKTQAVLGDTERRVIGSWPPVPDAALPTMKRKLIRINGVERKSEPST